MSYLLDKKIKEKKNLKIAVCVLVFLILFYFRSGLWGGLSYASQIIFRPVLIAVRATIESFNNLSSYFVSKKTLDLQNQNLQSKLNEAQARMANYNSLLADDASIKEILKRKDPKAAMTLAAILSKPNQSLYDTLVIDAGASQGIKTGDTVFAEGDVPIGRVDDVYPNSSKAILFSNPGERTQVVLSATPARPAGGNIFLELVGRGGGNFEMVVPRDLILQKGDQVVLPGITSYVLAIVATILSDPREPLTKALLTAPVNIQELKFVEIQSQK